MADNNNSKIKHEMPDNKNDARRRDNRPEQPDRRPMDRRNQNNNQQHGQHNNDQWNRKDFVKEKLEMMSGPTTNLVSKDGVSAKKFTGRCRLFVGNLPSTITDEEFRKMFEQFGEVAEFFLHKQKGFGFVKLWFSNLVTPAWWDDLWLNEGFASYMEYVGVGAVHPEWQMDRQFVLDNLHDMLELDCLRTSHPVSVPVRHPGEINEIFDRISYAKDTRQNAKASLDFTVKDGKCVRFATHGAALKVKNLSPWISNELLESAFSVFGDVERAVVVVDDRGRPIGEGIVEYARKQSAQLAIKRCNEGCYLLTSSPRPVVVEPLEQRDEEDGLPEKNFQKDNKQYAKERKIGPRLTEPGTFEHEFSSRWKKLYELEQQKREHLEKEIEERRRQLDEQMEYAIYEHEANLLRESLRHMEDQSSLIQREREIRQHQSSELKSLAEYPAEYFQRTLSRVEVSIGKIFKNVTMLRFLRLVQGVLLMLNLLISYYGTCYNETTTMLQPKEGWFLFCCIISFTVCIFIMFTEVVNPSRNTALLCTAIPFIFDTCQGFLLLTAVISFAVFNLEICEEIYAILSVTLKSFLGFIVAYLHFACSFQEIEPPIDYSVDFEQSEKKKKV